MVSPYGSGVVAPTVPGLDVFEASIVSQLFTQWDTYRPRNLARAARYDGKNAVLDLGVSTPPHLRSLPLVLGWPAKTVDMLNDHLRLASWVVDGAPADGYDFNAALDANNFGQFLPQVQASAMTHSVAFLIVTQGDTAAGEPDVLVTARDALTGTGLWNPRTRALDAFLSITDVSEDSTQVDGFTVYLPNLTVTCSRGATGWVVDRRSHIYGVPVVPLVYNPDLRRPMGRSRITRALMSIHDSALRTMLRSEISAEFYSVPKTILLGADESAFGGDSWRAVVGRIMALPDDDEAENPRASVVQLATAPQTPHMEQLRAWGQLFAHEAGLPVSSLGIIGEANPTSADAIEAGRADLVTRAEVTAEAWSHALRQFARLVEQVATRSADAPAYLDGLRPDWRNPRFTSRGQAAAAGAAQVAAAPWLAETEVGLELLGLTPSQIDRAMADKRRAMAVQRAAALSQAASAVRGQAASSNGVS